MLGARVAGLEAKLAKPAGATTDPAATARVTALEKSYTALHDELAVVHERLDKLAADGIKSAPDAAAPAVDLSAITARLDAIERLNKTQSSEIAQENAKPTDDVPLRRVVVASLLDISVRQGDPFAATLAAAKSLAPDTAALTSLEGFAASGVPTAAILSRELLTLVPKLSPPREGDASGASLVEKLQAGAERLVKIERTDATGTDRGAVIARVTAAALPQRFKRGAPRVEYAAI